MDSVQATNATIAKLATSERTKDELKTLSRALEASFLAEMLKSAGVGQSRDAFGGGAGEDHFSGFLVREYADALSQAGGLGLSEAIYRSLTSTQETAT